MAAVQSMALPSISPIVPANIPAALTGIKRWFAWRAGPIKPNGKFDKIPIDPVTKRNVNPNDPTNWYSFKDALGAYNNGVGQGLGIALSDQHPVSTAGQLLYLIAIDLDNCRQRMADHEALWKQLGQPYVETSPSREGLRMLGLSRTPIQGGNAGDGRELYGSKRYVTVTGNGGRGALCDFTSAVSALERQWFGGRAVPKLPKQSLLGQPPRPEHPAFVEPVMSMLDAVSSDTNYGTWRDIIYSLASTGWACARQLAHIWSAKALYRYDGAALDKLFDSYDPTRGITIGTLAFHARKTGWTGNSALLQMHSPPSNLPQPPSTLLMTADQLRQLPVTPYVVRSVFPAQGLAAIYGEPGSGKSFLALDLAHAISTGADQWFGFRVRQAPVAYVALEGKAGIRKRVIAIEAHSKQTCPDQLRFWDRDIHLLTRDGIDLLTSEIIAAMGCGAIVIIDTLNQASPGADENSSSDMGRIIANSKRLAAAVQGLVILVHHAGKNRAQGLRGHSSLLAAMDTVIEVSKFPRRWSITKAKNDSSDVSKDFDLVPYTVGQDEDGASITSCAVQQTAHILVAKKKAPTGKHQKAALQELRIQLPNPGDGVEYKAALALIASALDCPQSKSGDRAKEAVQALLRDGHLITNEKGLGLA
ncbi:MAG: AAA family ATPase [Sphingorhabdus sp.]